MCGGMIFELRKITECICEFQMSICLLNYNKKGINKSILKCTCAHIVVIISPHIVLFSLCSCPNFSWLILSSPFFNGHILSLQLLGVGDYILKNFSCYNLKYIKYRNLAILILFWIVYRTHWLQFLWLFFLTISFGGYLQTDQDILECPLYIVTSVHMSYLSLFLWNIIKENIFLFLLLSSTLKNRLKLKLIMFKNFETLIVLCWLYSNIFLCCFGWRSNIKMKNGSQDGT
jgi:hypothetical protein